MRRLIAEDERKLARAPQKVLQAEQFASDVAYDGEEALELATSFDYDLLILDLMLPKMEGLKVLARLRGAGSAVPVLIFSVARAVLAESVLTFEKNDDSRQPFRAYFFDI